MEQRELVVLSKIGLTSGEVRVYLALVNLGSTTVGAIIEKAKVSSSKVYVILERLIQKGLATFIIKEKTKYFQANPPTALMDLLKEKEKELKSNEDDLAQLVSKLRWATKKPKVEEAARIYKGFDGIKTGMLEAIESIPKEGDYYFFSTGYGEIEPLKTIFAKITLKLKEIKAIIWGVADISERMVYKKFYPKYKMRFLDFFFPSDVSIIGDYICILVYDKEEPLLYSIKSEKLVNSYKRFFDKMWEIGKA